MLSNNCIKQYKFLFYGLYLVLAISGCAAAGIVSSAIQVATGITGMNKKVIDPNATSDVSLKIAADKLLNVDSKNNSYALVIKIYHLKQSATFQQAFYDIFLDSSKEQEMFGMDMVLKKEITLIPGQTYNNIEKVNLSSESIGVVAFFQKPAATRWKFTFPIKSLTKEGLLLNVSGCSISVLTGTTLEFGTTQQNQLKKPANCR